MIKSFFVEWINIIYSIILVNGEILCNIKIIIAIGVGPTYSKVLRRKR